MQSLNYRPSLGTWHSIIVRRAGIERNIRGNSPAVIRREIRPEAVELPRRRDEGAAPLHRRDEFRTRDADGAEKRTIKVGTRRMRAHTHTHTC